MFSHTTHFPYARVYKFDTQHEFEAFHTMWGGNYLKWKNFYYVLL